MFPEYKYQPNASTRSKITRHLRKEQQTKQGCASIAEAILQSSETARHSENTVLELTISDDTFGRLALCESVCPNNGHSIIEHVPPQLDDHAKHLQYIENGIIQAPLLLTKTHIIPQEERQLCTALWKEPIITNGFGPASQNV